MLDVRVIARISFRARRSKNGSTRQIDGIRRARAYVSQTPLNYFRTRASSGKLFISGLSRHLREKRGDRSRRSSISLVCAFFRQLVHYLFGRLVRDFDDLIDLRFGYDKRRRKTKNITMRHRSRYEPSITRSP